MKRWKKNFCQLLNVNDVNDTRQTKIHTAEPLLPELNSFKVEIATEKLKRYKLPGTEQMLAELIQAGGNTLCSEIHKLLLLFGIKEKCHSSGRTLSLCLFIKRVIKLILVIIEGHYCYQLHINFIKYSSLKIKSICRSSV
jgi:hypothetical protein